jgi:tripartite-type tricarboxylate transporter receptor subunit TctC
MFSSLHLFATLVILTAPSTMRVAAATEADDLYKDKTIRMLISHPPGGGYDVYARLFARHLPRFLPGNPQVVPQNMPGAAGAVMASHMFSSAPQDGTVIGLGPGSTGTAALFGSNGARYDARQLSWIGSMTGDVAVAISWGSSPVKTARDLFTTELITGGVGVTDQSVMYPNALNKILGTKFKVVAGYGGSPETSLAMERGETGGIGAMNFSSVQANKPDWLSGKKINVLIQYAISPHPDLENVPTVVQLTRNQEERELLQLIFAQSAMARAIYGPPNVPPERLRLLRSAFDRMMKDPEFLADAAKQKMEINQPMPGNKIADLVDRLYSAKPELIARAREAVGAQ